MQNKKGFIDWLEMYGCTILKPTNQYEVVRWRGNELGIIYTTGKANKWYAKQALYKFEKGKIWHSEIFNLPKRSGNKGIGINIKFKTLEVKNTAIEIDGGGFYMMAGFAKEYPSDEEIKIYASYLGYSADGAHVKFDKTLNMYEWYSQLEQTQIINH